LRPLLPFLGVLRVPGLFSGGKSKDFNRKLREEKAAKGAKKFKIGHCRKDPAL
jgi:hypothetical protein